MRSVVGTRPGARAAPTIAGSEVVTWRGRASVRRDARDRQQPQVLRSRLAFADRRDPSAVGEPAHLAPDAVPGVDPLPAVAELSVRGVFGGLPRPLPLHTRSVVGTRPGPSAAATIAGSEVVTWRGRASTGATPGTGSSHRSCGRVSLSPIAATHPPSASQPTCRQTPSQGLIRWPAVAELSVRGVFGGRPRPRFGGGSPSSALTTRSTRPSWISTWTKRLPSGDGSGSNPTPRPNSIVWMPCSRSPDVSTIRSRPSAVSRTTWDQPSASDTNRIEPSGSQLASESKLVSPATVRSAPVATSTSTICAVSRSSGRRWAVTAICVPSGDQARDVTSTPAGVRARASGARGSFAGRPRRGTGASMTQTCDQPRRRETNASRFPSGDQRGACVPALWPVTFARRDPSASITQISSSRTNARRRPSGDHCGSLTGCSEAVSWVG